MKNNFKIELRTENGEVVINNFTKKRDLDKHISQAKRGMNTYSPKVYKNVNNNWIVGKIIATKTSYKTIF